MSFHTKKKRRNKITRINSSLLPGGHLHSYVYGLVRLQVPPLWHCDGEQGIYFDSQFLPVCPGGQIHLFMKRKRKEILFLEIGHILETQQIRSKQKKNMGNKTVANQLIMTANKSIDRIVQQMCQIVHTQCEYGPFYCRFFCCSPSKSLMQKPTPQPFVFLYVSQAYGLMYTLH